MCCSIRLGINSPLIAGMGGEGIRTLPNGSPRSISTTSRSSESCVSSPPLEPEPLTTGHKATTNAQQNAKAMNI
ncbi:uncharacterized [Tachysurus ichikawai]